jgi:hypothetical protein
MIIFLTEKKNNVSNDCRPRRKEIYQQEKIMSKSRYKLSESIPNPAEACQLTYNSLLHIFGSCTNPSEHLNRPATGKEAVWSITYPAVLTGTIACLNIFYADGLYTLPASVTLGIWDAGTAINAVKNCHQSFFTSLDGLKLMYPEQATSLEEPLTTHPSSDANSPHHTV